LLGSALVQAAPAYQNDFSSAELDDVPLDLMVMDGDFAVRDFQGNRVLELPGAPLETFGVLFGPSGREGLRVSAKIHATRKGRRYPAFAVSLGGVGGFRLQATPAKRALEILKGDEVVTASPWKWASDRWTHLRLEVRKTSDDAWQIAGKAWSANETEPAEWLVKWTQTNQPTNGKAGVWGKPFSGTPIRFDDLTVEKLD
jgi:hypothetical protein